MGSEKNDSNVTNKKYVMMNKEQITSEVNINKNHFNDLQQAVTYQTISNQTASNDSIINSSKKSSQTSVDLSKSPMCKNEIATMIAMMMRPMQQQIQMLTNKISYLENQTEPILDIKIEP